jgi:hypothetical protein
MFSTESGIHIDSRGHSANALSPILESFDPDSNVTAPSRLQPKKQSLASILTDAGIQIDFSDLQTENADFSIRESFDSDSNVRRSRPVQAKKHDLHRISTDDGMQIDFRNEEWEKVDFSIRMRDDGDSKVTLAKGPRQGTSPKEYRERT